MNVASLLLILLCVAANSGGQVLLKKYALIQPSLSTALYQAPTYALLLPGILLYVAGMTAWVGVLRDTPLHIAYPVLGLSFLVVPLFSAVFLGERVMAQTFIGGTVIILGIYLSVRPA